MKSSRLTLVRCDDCICILITPFFHKQLHLRFSENKILQSLSTQQDKYIFLFLVHVLLDAVIDVLPGSLLIPVDMLLCSDDRPVGVGGDRDEAGKRFQVGKGPARRKKEVERSFGRPGIKLGNVEHF